MPELRKDPIVGRWVIIAHERAKRPHDFKGEAQAQAPAGGLCPFIRKEIPWTDAVPTGSISRSPPGHRRARCTTAFMAAVRATRPPS